MKHKKLLSGLVVLMIVVVVAAIIAFRSGSLPQDSLRITEWHLKLPLSPSISDAYYELEPDDQVYISTKQIEKLVDRIRGCTSGLHGLYFKRNAQNPAILEPQQRIEPACVPPENDDTARVGSLQEDILAAAQAAVPE